MNEPVERHEPDVGRHDCVLLIDEILSRRAFCRKVGRCVVAAGAVELVSLVPFLTGCETPGTTTTSPAPSTTTTELPTATTTSADPIDCTTEATDCVIVCTAQCTDYIDCTECTDQCIAYIDCAENVDSCTESCTDGCTESIGNGTCDYCTGGCIMCVACNTPNIGGLCSQCVMGTY